MKHYSKTFEVTALIAVIGFSLISCGLSTSSSYFTFDSTSGTITGYSSDGPKDVKIPGKINGTPVTNILADAFKFKQLTGISIPGSVIEIDIDEIILTNNYTLTSVTIWGNTRVKRVYPSESHGFYSVWDSNGRQAGTYLKSGDE